MLQPYPAINWNAPFVNQDNPEKIPTPNTESNKIRVSRSKDPRVSMKKRARRDWNEIKKTQDKIDIRHVFQKKTRGTTPSVFVPMPESLAKSSHTTFRTSSLRLHHPSIFLKISSNGIHGSGPNLPDYQDIVSAMVGWFSLNHVPTSCTQARQKYKTPHQRSSATQSFRLTPSWHSLVKYSFQRITTDNRFVSHLPESIDLSTSHSILTILVLQPLKRFDSLRAQTQKHHVEAWCFCLGQSLLMFDTMCHKLYVDMGCFYYIFLIHCVWTFTIERI